MAVSSRTQLTKLAISVVSVAAVAGITGYLSRAASGEGTQPTAEGPETEAPSATDSSRSGETAWWGKRERDHDDDDDDDWEDDDDDERWELLFEARSRTSAPAAPDAQSNAAATQRRTRTRRS